MSKPEHMRLLRVDNHGALEFDEAEGGSYAILSHTWDPDWDEVTFKDVRNQEYKNKAGYRKIAFCGAQAKIDDLQYFWVDTCCIDQSSSAELSEALNSMFWWYRSASKCYVYLSDVSSGQRNDNYEYHKQPEWETAFGNSRWFRRGWTLMELLAPPSVEFFSKEGERLGDRSTLELQIHNTTGIPLSALRGRPMFEFSVDERLGWASHRMTAKSEDRIYSLLGLFNVFMPLLYGEGYEKAFARLKKEIYAKPTNILTKSLDNQSPADGKTLRYSPLSGSDIRLFVLEPGELGDVINGEIELFNVSDCPAYYALSYVWGEEPPVHKIIVDGDSRFIPPNLFHALQRIRSPKGYYNVWVDSLCINQLDSFEKNIQVQQMATIYSEASGVLVWLGEENSTSRSAMNFVREILSKDFKWEDSWWKQYDIVALAQLLDRSWFRRGWVLQEAVYSKTMTLRCGDREIYMDHFIMVVNAIRDRLSTVPIPSAVGLANFRYSPATKLLDILRDAFIPSSNGKVTRRRFTLETLVYLTTSNETTDPRDVIYALLKLANDEKLVLEPQQREAIVPDYRKTVLDVFVDFIMHCCSSSGSVDILCRPWAPVPSPSIYKFGNKALQSYPSWIASRDKLPFGDPLKKLQYRLHGKALVGGSQQSPYNAHYGSKPQVSFEKDMSGACTGILHVGGLILGEITMLSPRMVNAVVSKECLEILQLMSHRPPNDFDCLLDVIWRTLCGDRDDEGRRAPRSYSAAMLHLLQLTSPYRTVTGLINQIKKLSSIDVEDLLSDSVPTIVEEYLTVVRNVVWNRRTCCFKRGETRDDVDVGLVPPDAKVGDLICILYGCSVPVVLRSNHYHSYTLIGDAYAYRFMDGEAISSPPIGHLSRRPVKFRII